MYLGLRRLHSLAKAPGDAGGADVKCAINAAGGILWTHTPGLAGIDPDDVSAIREREKTKDAQPTPHS